MDSYCCDFCDDGLPEIKKTLAESLIEDKEMILFGSKFMAIPVAAFAVTCILNYWINRKVSQ